MKKAIYLVMLAIGFASCVQLPNLVPNGEGEDNDMVVVEYNDLVSNLVDAEELIVDENLTVNFEIPFSFINSAVHMTIPEGQFLNTLLANQVDNGLQSGDLVGGFSAGVWNEVYIPYSDIQTSLIVNLATDKDVVIGLRFKNDANQWHYGWVVFYVDTTNSVQFPEIYIRAIAYNKNPGTNVRILN